MIQVNVPRPNKNVIEGFIAISVIGCCALAEGMLLWKGAPSNLDGVVLGRILGTLDAAVMLVLSYYFGSTRSSMDQVNAITEIGRAAANTPIHISVPASTDQNQVKTTTVAAEAEAVQNIAVSNTPTI